MPARCPAFHVVGKSSQGIENPLGSQVDGLPMGVVEARLGPKQRLGRRVNRRITYGKLPWAIEWDDRRAQGDPGGSMRRINLSLGIDAKNKPGDKGERATSP